MNDSQSINISFFGAPNSGKSTLFNALMNQHIAIVSDKPQTTERITDSILQINNMVIHLFDTP
jgi:small GTP-binding protein